jgi:PhnB protein
MQTPMPDGWHTLTPRLFVDDPAAMVEFLRHAFGATGGVPANAPAEIRIGDSLVMVSATGVREAMPSCFHLYVDDVDATCQRAVDAGAEPIEEPLDTPYGDRRAMVRDPFGNLWQIAVYRGTSTAGGRP